MEEPIKCPQCGSTQLVANKKGFSVGKAAVGAALVGGAGLLAGAIGKDDIEITCLKCGNKFTHKDIEDAKLVKEMQQQDNLIKVAEKLQEEAKVRELTPEEKKQLDKGLLIKKNKQQVTGCAIAIVLILFAAFLIFWLI